MKKKPETKENPSKAFREQLKKLLPGYDWTVHQSRNSRYMTATGIQTSGFNRLSTLKVEREQKGNEELWCKVSGYGYGLRSPKMGTGTGSTLAQAMRSLQDYYESTAGKYRGLANSMAQARKPE